MRKKLISCGLLKACVLRVGMDAVMGFQILAFALAVMLLLEFHSSHVPAGVVTCPALRRTTYFLLSTV
jgi:hypothetical protein